ncbi:MAG: PQQ-binding-like beta-propeller repeat protein [Holosporales bacterium]|jgi:outer membrane protein assembly factor BamB|nr:PQQ-binding-like beta-propeller repeat protein [Holosporales bacterium]
MIAKNMWLIVLVAILVSACEKKEVLPGERELISGIAEDSREKKSKINSSEKIIPKTEMDVSFHVDVAGNKQHNSINYRMSRDAKVLWKTSIGGGTTNVDMIAFGENIYVVNTEGTLVCISQKNGKKIWEKQIAKQPDDSTFSGGLVADGKIIYISTNIGRVVAVDTQTQKELWVKSLKYPLKGAPLYASGKVIVNSIENQTFALNAFDGNLLWSRTSSQENTMMSEAGAPVLFENSVICTYSSGDLKSMNINDGSENWIDVLFSANLSESGGIISHIAASPVVFDDYVLAVTSESKMVLVDATSGIRVWEKNLGTTNTPVVNSGWVFVLSCDNCMLCLSTKSGEVKWVSELNEFIEARHQKITKWIGPLLINGDVVAFNEAGNVLRLDISTGKLKKQENFKDVIFLRKPIIINGRMFAMSPRANIYAIG